MLVLCVMEGQSIEIQQPGGSLLAKVTVVRVDGDKVRIGVDAPREYPVHRSCVADRIRRAAYVPRTGARS